MIMQTASLEITERVVGVVTETCVFDKYDLYVKFPQIVAHNVQMCSKFSRKIFTDVCPVF